MTKLSWNSFYQTGVEIIDKEHQKMFEIVNDILTKVDEGVDKTQIQEVWNQLVSITESHFLHEEKMMVEHRYPDVSEHEVEHENLLSELKEIQFRYPMDQITLNEHLIEVLKKWLFTHILNSDIKFTDFLNLETEEKQS